MKKLFIFATAVIAALSSCSKESGNDTQLTGSEKDFIFGVGLVDARYDMDAGGLGNLNPDDYSVRYILEVYSASGDESIGRYMRYVDILDREGTPVAGTQFKIRIPTQQYKFVVWADFVAKTTASGTDFDQKVTATASGASDVYYNTKNGLRNVSLVTSKYIEFYPKENGGRMVRDAYCGVVTVDMRDNDLQDQLSLVRPFSRIEVYGKGMDPALLPGLGFEPDSITVTYPVGSVSTSYDVFKQDVVDGVKNTIALSYGAKLTETPVGADNTQLFAFDYVFAPALNGLVSLQAKFFDVDRNQLPQQINATDKSILRNNILVVRGSFPPIIP